MPISPPFGNQRQGHTASSCSPLEGYAVDLWQCAAAGRYSMSSAGVTAENYLRGVQASNSTGLIKTSQQALPVAASQAVHATAGCSASVANLAAISLASDNVCSDGVSASGVAVPDRPTCRKAAPAS